MTKVETENQGQTAILIEKEQPTTENQVAGATVLTNPGAICAGFITAAIVIALLLYYLPYLFNFHYIY